MSPPRVQTLSVDGVPVGRMADAGSCPFCDGLIGIGLRDDGRASGELFHTEPQCAVYERSSVIEFGIAVLNARNPRGSA